MIKLTKRQQEILSLIQSHMTRHGSPPTRAEIAKIMGFKSPNAAEDHLRALARKGVIELLSGTSRGIRLTDHYSGLPVVRFDHIGRHEILTQQNIQQNMKVDPALFTPSVDCFIQIHQNFPELNFLQGDLLAIHLTNKPSSERVMVTRRHQEVLLSKHKDPNDLVEGWVVGLIRPCH